MRVRERERARERERERERERVSQTEGGGSYFRTNSPGDPVSGDTGVRVVEIVVCGAGLQGGLCIGARSGRSVPAFG